VLCRVLLSALPAERVGSQADPVQGGTHQRGVARPELGDGHLSPAVQIVVAGGPLQVGLAVGPGLS